MLSAEQILEAQDIQTQTVAVPEWGGEVTVRGLSGTERDRFENESIRVRGRRIEQNLDNTRARLCALCIVDEAGARLFRDDQVAALGRKSAAALDRVYEAAARLSGISQADEEELAGNSASAPAGAPGTA